MKHLIIIGAGGLGRCVYCAALNSIGYGKEFDIKGFINDIPDALDPYKGYPPIISRIDDYEIEKDDVFVCAFGDNILAKIKVCEALKAKGAIFQTLIHKGAFVGMNVKIGEGTIIDNGAHIDPDAVIGKNCLIQTLAIIGHNSMIEDYVRIDSHCALVGGTIVRRGACIYTHAMINHNVVIGENAVVGACSFVMKKVKPGTTVFGVPAKEIY